MYVKGYFPGKKFNIVNMTFSYKKKRGIHLRMCVCSEEIWSHCNREKKKKTVVTRTLQAF